MQTALPNGQAGVPPYIARHASLEGGVTGNSARLYDLRAASPRQPTPLAAEWPAAAQPPYRSLPAPLPRSASSAHSNT